jgi:hypothetical protein
MIDEMAMLDEYAAKLKAATDVITRIRELHGLPPLTWMNVDSEYVETIEAVAESVKATAPATVALLTMTLRRLRDEAPDGQAFVVLRMRIEDARRVPLFAETTIALRDPGP